MDEDGKQDANEKALVDGLLSLDNIYLLGSPPHVKN